METQTQLQKPETHLPVATTPTQLLELAINKDLDVEKLQKLMEMQREYNADIARKAFFEAFTRFQSNAPDLRKTKTVEFTTSSGGKTSYAYAPLAVIVRQMKQLCEDCSLTYRWEIDDTAAVIKVTCIITHSDGHSERTSMSGNADTSGSKNPIQARGSTIEYLKRYTLIGAFGLSTADTDIDAQLPELDVDKLHKAYMELFEKIVAKDESFRTPGDPDNWDTERTSQIYIKAIGKARQILAKLSVHD